MMLTWILYSVLCLAWLWAVLALRFFSPWPAWVRALAVAAWIGGTVLLFRFLPEPWLGVAFAVPFVGALWTRYRPAFAREWAADQARWPTAHFEGRHVTLRNMRHATYRTVDDYDVTWYDRTYALDRLTRMDFIIEPFALWRGLAHTFVSFAFDDGEHVAISVEVRREEGERFGPLKGLFKQFEVMYVVGDERDLIGLRANIRKSPVYLYPVKATPAQVQALFIAMLTRANRLAEHPEFYHTFTNTCATNIVRHIVDLSGVQMPFDLRVLFPGYADALAFELGLIDTPFSLHEARRRYLINPRSAFGPEDGPAWSRQIRTP